MPPTVALMLLGIPPLLAGTYAGIANVDPAVVDAARVDGHDRDPGAAARRGAQRAAADPRRAAHATLQVVATATVAAYASLGGLGRYLIDGIKVRQFHIALVGALMVTALALILDAAAGVGGVGVGAGQRAAGPTARPHAEAAARRRGCVRITSQRRFATALRRPAANEGIRRYGRGVSAELALMRLRVAWPADPDLARARRAADGIGASAVVRQPDQGLRPDRRRGHRRHIPRSARPTIW